MNLNGRLAAYSLLLTFFGAMRFVVVELHKKFKKNYSSTHFSIISLPPLGLNFTLTGIEPSHFNGNMLSSTTLTGKYSK